jgi:RES domain-containing protein
MFVWRISNHASLDGLGGRRAAGRWHRRGQQVVYAASSPAAALLEVLVRHQLDSCGFPATYKLLKIRIPDRLASERVEAARLPDNWRNNIEVTRKIGNAWLDSMRTPILWAPSVIVPETYNLLINPLHRHSSRIRMVDVQKHEFDERLR